MSEANSNRSAPGQLGCQTAEELLPAVYEELRRLAAWRLSSEPPGQTLQPTALVHEAWLRLVGQAAEPHFQNRTHFFATAAEAMRRILIDRARRKLRLRHGGGQPLLNIDDLQIATPAPDEELLAVDEALERLAGLDSGMAELVKLRYFVGMTLTEASTALGISEAAAKRQWSLARAWLFHEISTQSQ